MKEKVKKPFYKKWWFITIVALIIIGAFMQPSDEEKAQIEAEEAAAQVKADEEKKKEEEQKKAEAAAKEKEKKKKEAEEAEKAKKEKEERAALIEAFKVAAKQMVDQSNGVIPDVTIEDAGSYLQVKVYVDEVTWASSNESEKTSFSTTVGTAIENALAPNSTYIDILSATNKDVVASQKLFGGWKIKR